MNDFAGELQKQLRRDEGEVLHAYQDSLGYWTIGIGICIDKRVGCGITQEESSYLLANRINQKLNDLDRVLPWYRDLDPVRQGVLVNMCFQLGIDKLKQFLVFLGHLRVGRWETAAEAMLQSEWARQTPERAHRMAQQVRTGEWQ